jgi:hypothetical protein
MDPTLTDGIAHASVGPAQPNAAAPADRAENPQGSLASRDTFRRLRSIFSGSIGNLIEWYDWYVYSAFALYCGTRLPCLPWAFLRDRLAAGSWACMRIGTAAAPH